MFICSFLFIVYLIYRGSSAPEKNEKVLILGNYFLTIGICYYLLLSLASVYYDYNWGDLYRVSGFGILFILNAFWIYVYLLAKNWKKATYIILILLSFTKIGDGIRYEMINKHYRFLFQDYRVSITKLISHIDSDCKDVFVYIGQPWEGTNLFYMVNYYDMIYSLPFKVTEYSNQKESIGSVLLCTKMDLPYFKNYKFDFTEINKQKVFAHQFHSQ